MTLWTHMLDTHLGVSLKPCGVHFWWEAHNLERTRDALKACCRKCAPQSHHKLNVGLSINHLVPCRRTYPQMSLCTYHRLPSGRNQATENVYVDEHARHMQWHVWFCLWFDWLVDQGFNPVEQTLAPLLFELKHRLIPRPCKNRNSVPSVTRTTLIYFKHMVWGQRRVIPKFRSCTEPWPSQETTFDPGK